MKPSMMLLAGCLALVGVATADDTSAPTLVFTRPETSSFWNTATGSTLTLPIDFPNGATTATLGVTGTTYAVAHPGISAGSFELTLPEASDALTEDVYELTLTFDDGTVRTARLGLIVGLGDGAEGTARCVTSTSAAKWQRAAPHAVMPVPYGMTEFSINGVDVEDGDAGYTGAQGWYALQNLELGSVVPVSLTLDGETTTVPLTIRARCGMAVYVR